MEASYPMVIFYFIQYYYFVPGFLYNGMPVMSTELPFYRSTAENPDEFNRTDDHNWLGISCSKK